MNAILISIPPIQAASTLNRKQTIIIRKNAPKDWKDYLSRKSKKKPEPKTAYIYCTNDKANALERNADEPFEFFILNNRRHLVFKLNKEHAGYNGKVVAKFTLMKVEEITRMQNNLVYYKTPTFYKHAFNRACYLTNGEITEYLQNKKGYAWHISDLEIFDELKELSDFVVPDETILYYPTGAIERTYKPIKQAPRSWQYVEVRE